MANKESPKIINFVLFGVFKDSRRVGYKTAIYLSMVYPTVYLKINFVLLFKIDILFCFDLEY